MVINPCVPKSNKTKKKKQIMICPLVTQTGFFALSNHMNKKNKERSFDHYSLKISNNHSALKKSQKQYFNSRSVAM